MNKKWVLSKIESISSDLKGRFAKGYNTRFAPTPSGYLHLGHFFSLYVIEKICEKSAGALHLRIEDHDTQRSKPEYTKQIISDLKNLGFQFDAKRQNSVCTPPVLYQSKRKNTYEFYMKKLAEQNEIYLCSCSRKEISDRKKKLKAKFAYDSHCRGRYFDFKQCTNKGLAVRKKMSSVILVKKDSGFSGESSFRRQVYTTPEEEFGDIVIFDKDNNYSYQFCVVVDDIESNIDVVIRGEDIEPSTVKQAELWQSLSSKAPPVYIHHPLITSEGEKLSKSKDAPPLKDLLAQGLNREEIEKLMWKWIES